MDTPPPPRPNAADGSRCPFSDKTLNPLAPPHHEHIQELFAQARREQPVFFNEALGSWIVTRYEDIHAILLDTRRFSSKIDSQILQFLHPAARAHLEDSGYRRLPLIYDDPPEHTRARQLTSRLFSKESLARLEPLVRSLTERLVDGFIQQRQVDFVTAVAYPLPIRVIFEWMGLPLEMMDTFQGWAHQLTLLLSLQTHTPQAQDECVRAVADMQRYVAARISERVNHPRQDGMTELAQLLTEGTTLDASELAALVMLLITAGHETTAALLGMAIRVLLEQPERWRQLCEHPHTLLRTVEEILRYESPTSIVARTTTTEVEVSGVKVPAGVRVLLFVISANRDDQHFPRPDRFEPERPDVGQHLAFGKGIHVCVGAGLARLETRVMLEVLSRRLPGLRLVDPSRLTPGSVRHHERLLLAWD